MVPVLAVVLLALRLGRAAKWNFAPLVGIASAVVLLALRLGMGSAVVLLALRLGRCWGLGCRVDWAPRLDIVNLVGGMFVPMWGRM